MQRARAVGPLGGSNSGGMQRTRAGAQGAAVKAAACIACLRWPPGWQQQRRHAAHACGGPTRGRRSSGMQCMRAWPAVGQQQRRHAARAWGPTGGRRSSGTQRLRAGPLGERKEQRQAACACGW
jgi:hypothetical protein